MSQKTLLFTMLALILSVGVVQKIFAQDDDARSADFIKSRTYIGLLGTSATLDQWGNLNGGYHFSYGPATVVSGAPVTEVDLIPSITREFGFGVLVGHREGPWSGEISFWRSDHTATYVNSSAVTFTNPASLQAINIDFKRYFLTQLPTQPFVSLGMSFPWLWVRGFSLVQDGSGNTLYSDDETLSGIGFNLGAGLEIYFDNNISILGGLYQRWTGFNQINGAFKIPSNKLYLDGNSNDVGALEGDGLNMYVGTTVGFE